jgi:hypothetical protein
MNPTIIRLACGVFALLLGAVIVLRRRSRDAE